MNSAYAEARLSVLDRYFLFFFLVAPSLGMSINIYLLKLVDVLIISSLLILFIVRISSIKDESIRLNANTRYFIYFYLYLLLATIGGYLFFDALLDYAVIAKITVYFVFSILFILYYSERVSQFYRVLYLTSCASAVLALLVYVSPIVDESLSGYLQLIHGKNLRVLPNGFSYQLSGIYSEPSLYVIMQSILYASLTKTKYVYKKPLFLSFFSVLLTFSITGFLLFFLILMIAKNGILAQCKNRILFVSITSLAALSLGTDLSLFYYRIVNTFFLEDGSSSVRILGFINLLQSTDLGSYAFGLGIFFDTLMLDMSKTIEIWEGSYREISVTNGNIITSIIISTGVIGAFLISWILVTIFNNNQMLAIVVFLSFLASNFFISFYFWVVLSISILSSRSRVKL